MGVGAQGSPAVQPRDRLVALTGPDWERARMACSRALADLHPETAVAAADLAMTLRRVSERPSFHREQSALAMGAAAARVAPDRISELPA